MYSTWVLENYSGCWDYSYPTLPGCCDVFCPLEWKCTTGVVWASPVDPSCSDVGVATVQRSSCLEGWDHALPGSFWKVTRDRCFTLAVTGVHAGKLLSGNGSIWVDDFIRRKRESVFGHMTYERNLKVFITRNLYTVQGQVCEGVFLCLYQTNKMWTVSHINWVAVRFSIRRFVLLSLWNTS